GTRPVERLRHARHLVEVHPPQSLHQRRYLARESVRGLGRPSAHDLHLLVEVGVVDPVVEAAALEGVVHLARPVGRDDDEWDLPCLDGADLRDRDLELREQLEEEGFELLVGAVDLVDEENRRCLVVVVDGVEQRTLKQELGAEDLALGRAPVYLIAWPFTHEPDVQQLPRVVPLVDSMREVDPLIALEPDQPGPQHLGHHLGRLGLADARLTLDEQRLLELEGEKDRCRQRTVADVAAIAKAALDVLDRRGSAHARKEYVARLPCRATLCSTTCPPPAESPAW